LLVYGFRRLAAMDLLHEGRKDYVVSAHISAASNDMEAAAENIAENSQVPPKDFELAEGVSLLRTQHGFNLDQAIERLFSREGVNVEYASRVRRATIAWENLIQPLRELWRKNTPLFQLREAEALREYAPLEQEEWFAQQLRADEDPVLARIPEGSRGKPGLTIARRPKKSHINKVFLSIKQGANDPHDDGLTPEERPIAVKLLRWILGVPVSGKAQRCPIRRRNFDKQRTTDPEE